MELRQVPASVIELVEIASRNISIGRLESPEESGIGPDHTQVHIENQNGFPCGFEKSVGVFPGLIKVTLESVDVLKREDSTVDLVIPGFVGTNAKHVPGTHVF